MSELRPSTSPTPRIPMVIDTDGGVDDAVALWWAATNPAIDLVAVTCVWGNVDIDRATANVCTVLHAAGRDDVPVARGEAGPVGVAPDLRPADFIHGTDGLGDVGHGPAPWGPVEEHAVDMLARLATERPGELSLVAVGPLSNLGAAVRADPAFASRWKELVIMGGTAGRSGNAAPAAEANIAHDPVAASIVVGASWRTPPLMVGLDVTHRATFTDAELALAREGRTAAARFLAGPLAFYQRFGGTFAAEGECPCHDLLAVIAAVHPGVVDAPELPLAVQAEEGPAWGATIVDLRELAFRRMGEASRQSLPDGFSTWRIALDVDVARFRTELRSLFE